MPDHTPQDDDYYGDLRYAAACDADVRAAATSPEELAMTAILPDPEAMCGVCAHRGRWHGVESCTARVGSPRRQLEVERIARAFDVPPRYLYSAGDGTKPCPCPGFREAPLDDAKAA